MYSIFRLTVTSQHLDFFLYLLAGFLDLFHQGGKVFLVEFDLSAEGLGG